MRFSEYLRREPDAITGRWLELVRALPSARRHPPLALLDQMPQIIGRLAEVVANAEADPAGALRDLPREHALDRLHKGFELVDVLREYSLLRQAILERWAEHDGQGLAVGDVQRLAIAIDHAIAETLRLAGERGAALLRGEQQARGEAERDAGEQRDLVQALKTAEARLRLAAEATGLGTFDWAIDTGQLIWSDESRRIFGLSRDFEVTQRFVAERCHPGDRGRLEAALQRAMDPNGDGKLECDNRFRRLDDGAERWVLSHGRVYFDEAKHPRRMIGTLLDITDRKREVERQRFLADATALLSSTLDDREILEWITRLAVPALGDWAAVDLAGEDGQLKRVAAAHVQTEKSAEILELAQKFPDDPGSARGVYAVLRSGKPELVEHVSDEDLRGVARNEEHYRFLKSLGLESFILVPLSAHGRVLGTFSLVSVRAGRRYDRADLDLVLNLAQRAALNVENARLYQESIEAAKQREQMLAIVSHDLRNPLNAIVVAGALLSKRLSSMPGEERARRHAEIVERSSKRMEQLIDHLLDVASIQAGRLKIESRPEAPVSLLEEVLELEAPLASEHGIALSADCLTGPGDEVAADRARLLEVFENLIGNSLKFCQQGDSIFVGARRGGGCVVFSVSDTGPGIPEDERPHVFAPYWTAAKRDRGTGLGLFICQGVVEAHGGSIWVESREGQGTTFYFTVPLAAGAGAREEPRPSIH